LREQVDAFVDDASAGAGADVVGGGQFGVCEVGAQERQYEGGLGGGVQ